jgi:hypothetical protein
VHRYFTPCCTDTVFAAMASQFSKFITPLKDKLVSLLVVNCKGIVAVFPFNNTSIEQVLSAVTLNSPEISSVPLGTPEKNFKILEPQLPVHY